MQDDVQCVLDWGVHRLRDMCSDLFVTHLSILFQILGLLNRKYLDFSVAYAVVPITTTGLSKCLVSCLQSKTEKFHSHIKSTVISNELSFNLIARSTCCLNFTLYYDYDCADLQ